MSVQILYGRMPIELVREKSLRSFAKCVREWVLVDKSNACDGDVWVVLVKSGLIIESCCSTLKNYELAAEKTRISRTAYCKTHEQKMYASSESNADRRH